MNKDPWLRFAEEEHERPAVQQSPGCYLLDIIAAMVVLIFMAAVYNTYVCGGCLAVL
jgi:hypothetical protein